MDENKILEETLEILASVLNGKHREIITDDSGLAFNSERVKNSLDEDSELIDNFMLNQAEVIEFFLEIESHFGIDISEDEEKEAKTIDQLCYLISSKI